jgi:hypothetical protein
MKRKSPAASMKAKKLLKQHAPKKTMANAIEMKLAEIKTSHRRAEPENSHLSIFRYAG